MAKLIDKPTEIRAHGNIPKIIREFVGRANSGTDQASIAVMESPAGWEEPGQTPEFDEYTLVLEGSLQVQTREHTFEVAADQAIIAPRGQWVRYSSPAASGARYIAICVPAFSPETVHRDE